MIDRRVILAGGTASVLTFGISGAWPALSAAVVSPWAAALIRAARAQVGVTTRYDGAYVALGFPGGDIPRERGVCTDVIIRAYRDAFSFDLQLAVNTDMAKNFRAYPKNWGLRRPDRNIDHRRVPNLQTFFRRRYAEIRKKTEERVLQPGDLQTQMVGGRLPHIGIVSDRRAYSGRPLLIHNIGGGTQEEDVTATYPVTGHYRFKPKSV